MSSWSILQILSTAVVSGLFLSAVVLLIWWIDRYDREPLGVVGAAFVWGAIGASTLAVMFEAGFVESTAARLWSGGGTLASVTLLGVVFEEVLKAAGVVAIAVLSERFDNPTDGIVYGTAAGLGFAAAENILHGSALAIAGAPGAGAAVVLLRTVSSALLHGLATGAFGALLGVGYLSRSWLQRLGWCLLGLLAAGVFHGAWNVSLLRFPTAPLTWWIAGAPVLLMAWLGLLSLMLMAEKRILVRELAEEVRLGVLPPWVVDVLPSYRRRIRPDWWPNRVERTLIARLLTRLAFRKHAVGHLPVHEAALAGLEVVSLRRRARRILGLEIGSSRDGVEG